ncbi:MAG: ATP-binding protein [bacterium]
MMTRFSIRIKLIAAFIIIGVFPMLVATYIGVKIASGRLEKGIEERINYAGKSAVYLIARKKTELEGVARSLSGDPRLRKVIQGGVNIKFLWFDTPLQVYLFNHENTMIFASTGEKFARPKNPAEGMTLLRTQSGNEKWPLLVFLLPVSDQGRSIGTIMTGYPLDNEFLNDLKSVTGVESMFFKQDPSGGYFSIETKAKLDIPEDILEKVAINGHQAFTKYSRIRLEGKEEEYHALLTPLPDADGRVSYILFNGISASETLSRKLASTRFYYILILIGVLLSVIAGSALGTGISWPIVRLSNGVRAISAGDYNQKIQVHSRDEIGELAESFNLMTDRLKETIAKLVENQSYTENILRSLLNGVMTIDPDARIIRINHSTENILHLPGDKIVGEKISVVFDQDPLILELIQNGLENRRIKEGLETVLHRKDGAIIPIELSLSPLDDPGKSAGSKTGLVVLIRDLTEIQALKEHIRRQDRLAAMGELSAGIAHEIRNPLGIIKGAAGILKRDSLSQAPRFDELCSVILEEVDRLNDVISDFLEFARPRPPQFKPQTINKLISGTIQMAALQIEKNRICIHENLAPDLPLVMADEHQMHQMFLNLILNAIQAMDQGDSLEIATRYLPEVNQIEIIFEDTGIGIPEGDLNKVFNPFFTTKEQGTGLGLSVVSKIIENHQGKIFLSSEAGKGTRFTIHLPVADKFDSDYQEDIHRTRSAI